MSDIRCETAGGIATITLDRPEQHNAFREQGIRELIDAFDAADADPDVGVVVLTGAGDRPSPPAGTSTWSTPSIPPKAAGWPGSSSGWPRRSAAPASR